MRTHSWPIRTIFLATALAVAGCGSSTTSPPGSLAPSSSAPPSVDSQVPTQLPLLADVPLYRGDAAAHAIHPGPGPTGKPALAWQVNLGKTDIVPILVGGLLIVGTRDGRLVALDAHSGDERWMFTAHAPIQDSLAAAAGLVYASDGSALYAVEASTGAERWSTPVPRAGSRLIVVDGIAYVGTQSGVLGLDAATGGVVWRWNGPNDVTAQAGPVVDGVGYFAAGNGRLYAVDMIDGTERWHIQTISLDIASAEVVGDTVYLGTNQGEAVEPVGQIYAVDRASGRVRWVFRTASNVQLNAGPVRDGVLYASGLQDGLYALRDDGSVATEIWHLDTPAAQWPMALVGETLYEQRLNGSVGAYAIGDGRLLWETPATGDSAGGPIVSGGMLFVADDMKGVMAFADPTLIALLPKPVVNAPPSVAPSMLAVPNPFTIVRAFSWDRTKLAIPLGMDVGPDALLYILDTRPAVTVIDPADGHIVRTWGRQGSGPGEFDVSRSDDNPGFGDVAVGTDGRVYVADGSNHRVQVFGPDGSFLSQFGSFGTGEGQFRSINEIAIAHDGSVYVHDGAISKFTADGKFRWRSPNVEAAVGMAVRADGTLLATCEPCKQLLLLDPGDGHVSDRWDMPQIDGDGFGPVNIDPSGNIYMNVNGSESQLVFDNAGRFLGGQYLREGDERNEAGKETRWGDIFMPSPVFLPDGRAFSFGRGGLLELKVTLPN